MIPSEDTLLQAISSYYPHVWPFLMEDYKGDNETTKREKDARIDAEFLRWVDEVKLQERINDACRRLGEISSSRGSKEFEELVAHVLVACFGVTPYAGDLRSNQLKLRDHYRDCIKNLNAQFKALKSFKQAYRRNKGYGFLGDSIPVSSNFFDALKKSGLQMEGPAPDPAPDPVLYRYPDPDHDPDYDPVHDRVPDRHSLSLDLLEALIDEYLQKLELDEELDVYSDLFFMRNKIDALIYPNEVPIQARSDDSAINSLLFHLSFIFRQYTSPDSDSPWLKNIKGEMPTDGQPCYGHVTDFANVLFSYAGIFQNEEQELSDKQVRQRVNDLTKKNGVYLGSLFTVDF